MKIFNNTSISNSLKIASNAKYYIEIHHRDDFSELNEFIAKKNLPILVIGEGTNLVLPDFFEGIAVKPMFNHINYDNALKLDDTIDDLIGISLFSKAKICESQRMGSG